MRITWLAGHLPLASHPIYLAVKSDFMHLQSLCAVEWLGFEGDYVAVSMSSRLEGYIIVLPYGTADSANGNDYESGKITPSTYSVKITVEVTGSTRPRRTVSLRDALKGSRPGFSLIRSANTPD